MSQSAELPMNFGGIDEDQYSSFEKAKVLVWPVSYEGTVSYGGGTGAGAMVIVDASRNMGQFGVLKFWITKQALVYEFIRLVSTENG